MGSLVMQFHEGAECFFGGGDWGTWLGDGVLQRGNGEMLPEGGGARVRRGWLGAECVDVWLPAGTVAV
jgi:hypothetical protein